MDQNNENLTFDSVLVSKATPEYLQELLKDKKQLQNFPNTFEHLEFLLEKEISRVRQKLFHINESVKQAEDELPKPAGVIVTLQEKVFVPVKEHPNEDSNRGKPNWEHLDEDLHVLVSVEDFENRASLKLRRASNTIRAFLEQGVRTPDGEDQIKKRQLMELAIMNGTYRAVNQRSLLAATLNEWCPLNGHSNEFHVCSDPICQSGDIYGSQTSLDMMDMSSGYKDRQQAHVQKVQQHQQLILQHQSLTVLNNHAAAAAAAAAAQFLQPNQYQANVLLSRLQSQASPNSLTPSCLYQASIPSALSPASTMHSISNTQLGQTLSNANSNSLTAYLQNPSLSGVLCPLNANAALSAAAAAVGASPGSTNTNGQMTLGLPLNQIISQVPGNNLSSLQAAGVSPNLINCTPVTAQDQLAVMAALFGGSGGGAGAGGGGSVASATTGGATTPNGLGSTNNLSFINGNSVSSSNSSANHHIPMTTNLSDAVNILEYNNTSTPQETSSGSLKLRSIQATSSTVGRMHPYLRQ